MEQNKLVEILEMHKKWLFSPEGGKRADLHGADLRGVNLHKADLREADLHEADLRGANLHGANLYEADLSRANLYGADLSEANLRRANLREADLDKARLRGTILHGADLYKTYLREANLLKAYLREANLCEANLRRANLDSACLREADLSGVILDRTNLYEADLRKAKNIPYIPMTCPEIGSFIGWKKVKSYIIKLQILDDSLRSSATSRKCRCDKALVLEIEDIDGNTANIQSVSSNFDESFIYTVGKIVSVNNFCMDRFAECAPGIHFFISREEAVQY